MSRIQSLLYKKKSTGDFFMVDKNDVEELDDDFIFISSIDVDEDDIISFDEEDEIDFEFEQEKFDFEDKPRKIKR